MNTEGGINTDLHFPTLQQCEQVKNTLSGVKPWKGSQKSITGACVEQQVKSRKLKCSIENKTDYTNQWSNSRAKNMEGYPYPVGFTCVEE
jgi:hypothetical protein